MQSRLIPVLCIGFFSCAEYGREFASMSRQWFQQLLPALKLELSSGFAMMQPNARRLTSRQRNVSIRSGFGWGRRSPDRVGQFAIRERERLAARLRHTGLEQQQLRQAYAPPVSVRCALSTLIRN